MDVSESHLEKALEEYNDKVNKLESEGPSEELLEAYVNRGSVLNLLEFYTSALEDMESACELIDILEKGGIQIDAGTFIKVHAVIAQIQRYHGDNPSEEYRIAATRLSELNENSHHFEFRSIMDLCQFASEDLLDFNDSKTADIYIDRALALIENKKHMFSLIF